MRLAIRKNLFLAVLLGALIFASVCLLSAPTYVNADHPETTADECQQNNNYFSAEKELCKEHVEVDQKVEACKSQGATALQLECLNSVEPASDGYDGGAQAAINELNPSDETDEGASATIGDAHCKGSFFGINSWNKYLEHDPESCEPLTPNGFLDGNIPWLIAAAVLEMLLKIAAITAVIMTIAGGYQIMTSAGTPEGLAAGRNKILSAITGFVIAIMATVMVSYLVGSLSGSAPPDPLTGLPQTDASNNALNFIFGLIYRIAAGVSVIFIALSGFKFVTGGGNPQQIAQARQSIYYALIGLVVVLVSVSIIALVGGRL